MPILLLALFHCISRIGEDAYRSLQLLELGRGILANLQLEVRSDISILAVSHPNLAKQFEGIRNEIDPPRTFDYSVVHNYSMMNSNGILEPSNSISERHALLKRFDYLLQHIRSLEGFENFLQGPSESELRSLAGSGAIVVFNVSDIRSDAFLIMTDEIRAVPLPVLTSSSLEDYVKRFLNAINERDITRSRYARREMNDVLGWLWEIAVKPVLQELGFHQMIPHDGTWPRVCWVGNGLLSILPIHAAGYHDAPLGQTTLDRVISSYASTVKSLSYARERANRAEQAKLNDKAILFPMPLTLPFVEEEVRDLKNLFSHASINATIMLHPTRAEALSKLHEHNIVHFACHGHSADDPSQSHLLLEDSSLTVSDLISLNIESAKFAYLSACHTSTMRNFRLLDESISLSSAVQLCGYPSVVGSLWQVGDKRSAEIAKDV